MCKMDYRKENSNYINELILHPNGKLGGAWNPEIKILNN
jgi:hypothetical protein